MEADDGQLRLRKQEMRRQILKKREAYPQQLRGEAIERVQQALFSLIKERDVKTLHTFLPMGDEMDHSPVVRWCLENKITVVTTKTLPKRQLMHLVLEDMDDLAAGVFGTRYPRSEREWRSGYDLIIVPGLAFDKKGNRLGYGGGYYDAFLATQPEPLKVAVAYPFQIVDEVPVGAHDMKVDRVLY